jgi:Holliday junction resolvase RusA-like endonuclease
MLKIEIPIEPVTKKNHSQVVMIKGRPLVLPSKPYQEYERKCKQYMPLLETPIDYPINLKCIFYKGTHRKCDITNLLQAVCDILVKYKVLEDDNYSIVSSVDGSYVDYDKENPRTEIYITKKEQ